MEWLNLLQQEQDDLDFILDHFGKKLFPRTISTYKSKGKQIEIFSKEEMIEAVKASANDDWLVAAAGALASSLGDAVGGTIVGGEMLTLASRASEVMDERERRRSAAVFGLVMGFHS